MDVGTCFHYIRITEHAKSIMIGSHATEIMRLEAMHQMQPTESGPADSKMVRGVREAGFTLVAASGILIAVVLALVLRGDVGPDFTGKTPEEIKAYFESDAFQRLKAGDQRAIKKKAYGPIYRQQEREFIERARFYCQLPPQRVRFVDERIWTWRSPGSTGT